MNGSISLVAVGLFFFFIALTLVITYWAARRSHTASELYNAGGQIKAWQNGWAIAGDILSASMLLGGVGMFYGAGYDALLYSFPAMAGFLVMLGFIAGPMRRMGRFTFADAVASRLSPVPIRVIAALSTLAVTLIYLVAQILGAGGLIQILFGIPYRLAVVIVGSLMVTYVAFGGMLATTWVQVTKALLLISGISLLALLALAQTGFSLAELYARVAEAHRLGAGVFQPGGLRMSTVDALSLCLGILLGMAGMPHLLMRFFTVSDEVTARRSLVVGITVVGFAYFGVYMLLGPAAVAFITNNPSFMTNSGTVLGGSNMIALHLARFLGGDVLFGVIAAVAFATILAVVSGLTVTAASAISHDLYGQVFAKGARNERRETFVFRAACVLIGVIGIGLGIAFEGQNILFLTGLLYAIAASACFPILAMSMYWDRLTTAGAVAGGAVGLVLSVGIIIIGPSVWVAVLGNTSPVIGLGQPAIVSVPAAFLTMIFVSLATSKKGAANAASDMASGSRRA